MEKADIILLALALSVDAGAVSFSHGLVFVQNRFKSSFLIAFFTGFFQFIMPVLGFIFAGLIYEYIKPLSTIIAFLIFLVLGLKFIYDALFSNDCTNENRLCCISLNCLFMLAIATSIDALAAGVNFRFLNVEVFSASVLIGLTTFFVSVLCFALGQIFKKFPSKYLEVLAGVLLVVLAIKTFFD